MLKTLFLASIITSAVFAAEVEMKPSKISLFKNGYGYVTMQGQLGDTTQTKLRNLPVPSVGTFWIGSPHEVQINSVTSGMMDFELPIAPNILNIAAANAGADVKISYQIHAGQSGLATGKLLPFPQSVISKRSSGSITPHFDESPNRMVDDVIMLECPEGKTMIIPADKITGIEYQGKINMPRYFDKQVGIELKLNAPAAGKTLEVSCLAAGISWAPSYRIDLGENGKAKLHAKATITNNLVDIDNVEIELITGVPSLSTPAQPDPIALRRIDDHMSGLITSGNRSGQGAYDMTMTQSVMSNSAYMGRDSGPAAPNELLPETGESTDNLFFYPLSNFSAKAGEVVSRNLFSAELEYTMLYTWDVEDPRNYTERRHSDTPKEPEVWSCIRFDNPLKMPLTTAHTQIIERGRIAGTNILHYTPAGRESTVKMNKAVNISTKTSCQLIKQDTVSHPTFNQALNRHTNKVELELTNNTKETAIVEVSQSVAGRVDEVGQGGVTTSSSASQIYQHNYRYIDRYNPGNVIKWTVEIPAGESKTLDFTYHWYIY